MSRSYPIWYDVTACKYKSDKSFGFRNTGEIEISIGSSIDLYFQIETDSL